MQQKKLIRITTVPQSLRGLLRGQLRFMSDHYQVIGISSPGEALDDVVQNEGVKVIPVTMSRSITPFADLRAMWMLYKIFKKEKPFIVHTHTPKAGMVGMFAAKLAGVRHRLHTVAGLPLLEAVGNKRKILDVVEKVTYSAATKVYPNSFGLYDIILKNKYCSPDKLHVIGNGSSNGIDTAFFDAKQIPDVVKHELKNQIGILPSDFVFIFVGRIVRDKGINELVTAFSRLNKEFGSAKLLLVGTFEDHLDPLLPETRNEIDSNEAIISVGYQADVRPYFAISDVLAFPSYREGFPNVVMQAGAMGLNCIVTDINGCNEIIEDGKNGFVIPVKQVDELHEKMKYLYLNPGQNDLMAAASRKKICDNYERVTVWNEILKEYQKLK